MKKQTNHEFEFYSREVEKFLTGERKNPIFSTTKSTARKLEESYHVNMSQVGVLSEKHGIYLFKIT